MQATRPPMTPHSTRVPPQPGETFLYASDNGPNISWLVAALQRRGVVVPVTTPCAATLDERIAALNPQAVFLDFSGEQVARAAVLHEQLKRDWPALAVVGTGSSGEPAAMLAALRAGVDDFVDVAAATADVNATLGALLERRSTALSRVRGRTVALLGARAGLGVSTLAANLTVLLQDTLARRSVGAVGAVGKAEPARGAALLDLGL
ncbi:MAG: response regulator, partial [Comamonadaceae bacterium]